jgi:hypothetical protein
MFPVKYTLRDARHISVEAAGRADDSAARGGESIRFEVDEIHGPARWSTVIAWGFLEDRDPTPADAATYRIRFTDVRGFYRGPRP